METKQVFLENIRKNLLKCTNYVQTLNGNVSGNVKVLHWFKEFCSYLDQLIASILDWYQKNGKLENTLRDSLILYLNQLVTSLSLLINVFVREADTHEILTETRLCVIRQIIWCLNAIESFNSKKTSEIQSGSFIKWMDLALDKIEEIDMEKDKGFNIKISNEAKLLFEEVLSHAMSIAQVALHDDCYIIKGACQSVLESLDSLIKEIHKSNINMVNLYIDICSNKLCALEAKVNTAVLKLSINVFSNYTRSLNQIATFCSLETNKNCTDVLDSLVADFDLQVDRIMQIGLFAVSCSTCADRCIKIRNCLASLEALECELVPAFTAVLLDKNKHNIHHAELLNNHWLQQANLLKNYIFLIIDPLAISKVIFEEIELEINDINKAVKKNNSDKVKELVSSIISKCCVFKDFLKSVLPEIQNEYSGVENIYVDLKNILHEIDSASKILLDKKTKTINKEDLKRILKRCKILASVIKKLLLTFAEENSQTEPVVKKSEQPANPFLDHIIDRGKQILKERSVLYKTVNENEGFDLRQCTIEKMSSIKKSNKSIPLSKFLHLRKLSFVNTKIKNESTIELQITDILKELTNLSTTLPNM